MLVLIRLFLESLVALFRPRAALVAENLALRHQLGILLRSRPARLPLTSWDRALWAFVLHRFPAWRQSLVIVRPETVIAWHRQAFRLFWRWKSQAGRPRAHAEVRRLIREMASDNPTWGEKETEWLRFHAPQAPGNSHCTPTLEPKSPSGQNARLRVGIEKEPGARLRLLRVTDPRQFPLPPYNPRQFPLHPRASTRGILQRKGRFLEPESPSGQNTRLRGVRS
jgi:hypothetical protein